jgi:CxxC motif-containing protein
MNNEIVTYLKGKKDFNDNNFIKEWSNFSSLIQADKDPGQYLPHLFIIYYFGPNKMIQDAIKKLIDDISPKEILEFQKNILSIVRQLDASISEVLSEDENADMGFSEYLDPEEDDLNFNPKITKERNKLKNINYHKLYIQSLFLPIFLVCHPLSIMGAKLKNPKETNLYLCILLERLFLNNLSFLQNNYFFLNYCLKPTQHNLKTFLSHGIEPDDEKYWDMEFEQATHNFIRALSWTKNQSALNFIESEIQGGNPDTLWYGNVDVGWDSYFEVLEDVLKEFDKKYTDAIRQRNPSLDPPAIVMVETEGFSEKHIVCITGKLNSFDTKAKAKDFIESIGFEVKSSLTKDVNILVNESGIESAKTKKARENKVRIVTNIFELKDKNINGDKDGKQNEKKLSAEKEYHLKLIKNFQDKERSHHVSDHLRDAELHARSDKEVVMAAVKSYPSALEFASKELQADKEIVMEALRSKYNSRSIFYSPLEFASKELQADKEVVMAAVKQYGFALKYASKELKADKEIVMAAIYADRNFVTNVLRSNITQEDSLTRRDCGEALQYASKELQADIEVVSMAIKQSSHALEFASNQLLNNKNLVLEALDFHAQQPMKNTSYGDIVRHISLELKDNKAIAMASFKNDDPVSNPNTLSFFSTRLRDDEEVVNAAITQREYSARYASERIRSNIKIISLDEDLVPYKNDKKIVMYAVKKNGQALLNAPKKLQADKEIVMAAVKQYGFALKYASKKLRSDKEVVIEAVMQNGSSVEYASKELKADKEVVMIAIKSGYTDILNVHSKNSEITRKLRTDKQVMMAAVKKDGKNLYNAHPSLKSDKELVMVAINKDGHNLYYASPALKADKEIVMVAIKKRGTALEFAAKELKSDKELVMMAVKKNRNALKYASIEMQKDSDVRDLILEN